MASRKPLVLLVEDSVALARVYRKHLQQLPATVVHVETGAAAVAAIEARAPRVILLDLRLPDMAGLDILRLVGHRRVACSVVVVTGHGSIPIAVEAMQAGAYDFLEKPVPAARLIVTVRNALEHRRLNNLVATFQVGLGREHYCGFIGSSAPMQAVYRIIDAAAASKASVFITGESGTGKEVCAEAIHHQGGRRERPFLALNCGAIPRELMESEVFGHVKGAFTGALGRRDGAATRAHGGTLFLDEICDMDPALQAKLLRFVQTGSFQRVGAGATETVDIRFVCATNRDPWAAVRQGRLREDLYYRLHVIPIELPPLRERGGDVLAIARAMLIRYADEEGKPFRRFAPDAEAAILAYRWPGNVRQLQNVIRNVVVLHQAETVTPGMLPASLAPLASTVAAPDTTPGNGEIRPLWRVERAAIEAAIARCGGSISQAAKRLEVSPSTIYRKRHGWDAA